MIGLETWILYELIPMRFSCCPLNFQLKRWLFHCWKNYRRVLSGFAMFECSFFLLLSCFIVFFFFIIIIICHHHLSSSYVIIICHHHMSSSSSSSSSSVSSSSFVFSIMIIDMARNQQNICSEDVPTLGRQTTIKLIMQLC